MSHKILGSEDSHMASKDLSMTGKDHEAAVLWGCGKPLQRANKV
jgi:hypothetical protein